MLCEICGKRKARFVVLIEGAKLYACEICAKGGKILGKIGEEEGRKREVVVRSVGEEEEVVEGYGELIKKARERLGLSREELARRINEKESYLEHLEKEEMLPSLKVARKLEKALGIKLIEKRKEIVVEGLERKEKGDEGFTLGDFVEG